MNPQVNSVSAFKLRRFKPWPPRCINLVAALICMSLSGIATGDIKVGTVSLQSSSAFDSISNTSGLFSSKSSSTHNSASATQAAGSSVGGNSVLLSAGNNIQVTGSDVIGNTATTFIAKNDVTIEAAQSSFKASNFSQTRESGLMSSGAGGIGFSIGNRNQSADAKGQGSSAVASRVGTIGHAGPSGSQGDLTIQAGGSYQQTGSDVLVPRGDVNISAQTINVVEARETSQSTSTQKFEQSGITVSLSTPMLSTMQSVQNLVQAAGQAKSDRSTALAGAAAALTIYNAANPPKTTAAKDPASADAAALSISISLGQQSSQSTTHTRVDQARGASITAGGNLNLTATGAGDKSNITIQGSNVKVAGDANFDAEGQIKLLAATNTHSEQSTNSSSSSSIGASFGIGAKGAGPSVTVSANQASGQGQGSGTTYTNTQLDVGNTVTFKSGGDTTIKGAVVNATTAQASIGGNLTIESVQASNNYTSSQSSSGGSLTVGTGSFGATASASKSNLDSNYQSTNQTSGIKAGDGGFNVSVAGNTRLTGGVITSTQKAVDDKVNSFQTGTGANGGTLTVKDLANSASFNASSQGGTIGVGSSLSATSIGVGNASGNAASVTTSGISGIAGNTAVRTGDAGTGIQTIFNKDEVQADVNAQVVITGAFGQQASSAWGKFSNDKLADAAKNQNSDDIACWSANGACRIAGHTLIGGATGEASGAAGAATGTYSAPVIAELIKDAGITGTPAAVLTSLLTTGVGTAVGGTSGGVAAFNEVNNNYLTSGQWNTFAKDYNKCTTESCKARLVNEYRDISNRQDAELATACKDLNSSTCRSLVTTAVAGTGTSIALGTSKALPDNFLAGGNFNSNTSLYVNKLITQDVNNFCKANPKDCDHGLAVLGGAGLLVGGTGTVALVANLPRITTAAGIAYDVCVANIAMCLNRVTLFASDVVAGEALGGASIAGGVATVGAGTKIVGSVAGDVRVGVNGGVRITSDIAPTTRGVAQFGPMSEAGPLPVPVANTFRSGTYAETVTTEPTVLYRAYGGTADQMGRYWTTTPPTGPVQSIVDSALNPVWGNPATSVVKIQVPPGVTLYQGQTAAQGGLVGGGNQVLFPKDVTINPAWIKP